MDPVSGNVVTAIEFFRSVDPAGRPAPEQVETSIKGALAEALVHYYPMAGRLRELPGTGTEKLVVDCTAEGAVLVRAHADVEVEQFGRPVVAPYPCVEELLCDVGDFTSVVGKPLLYLQMTQLRCGGLVLALTMCHSLADAFGMVQILRCIVDLARGQALPVPAVLPVWERHLLVSSREREAAELDPAMLAKAMPIPAPSSLPPMDDDLVSCSFLFGPTEIAALRSTLPAGFSSTVFELVTAAAWRCRAAALQHPAHQKLGLVFFLNARGTWKRDPPLPPGFYGNAIFMATAVAGAAELCGAPLKRVIELLRQAKRQVTDEHVRSVLHLLARGMCAVDVPLDPTSSFWVSDVTRCGDDLLDLGSWAEHVGGGAPMGRDIFSRMMSFSTSYKDINGDDCVLLPMHLPELSMGRFKSHVAAMTNMSARSAM